MLYKKCLFLILLLPLVVQAQTFEGFIEYQTTYTILDSTLSVNSPRILTAMQDIYIVKKEIYSKKDSLYSQGYSSNNRLQYTRLLLKDSSWLYNHKKQTLSKQVRGYSKYPRYATYELTNETKEILGFLCRKLIYTTHNKTLGNDLDFIVYYTEQLPSLGDGFDLLNGLVLYFETEYDGRRVVETATKIEVKPIPDLKCSFPKNYTLEADK